MGLGCAQDPKDTSQEDMAAPTHDSAADLPAAPADMGADLSSAARPLRVATFNASMWRAANEQLAAELADGSSAHAQKVARILQHIDPDVVLINEFDRDSTQLAVTRFIQNYLQSAQNAELKGLVLKSAWAPETNTGAPSELDLDNNGMIASSPGTDAWAGDSFGFGRFPGQYGMLILAKHPIQMDAVRTFRTFRWKDMPDHLIPTEFYDPQEQEVLRLSSKNHVDIPLVINGQTLHLLASHPTPPAFDGAEQRNKRRNSDEIRFWADYIDPARSAYIYDDAMQTGGLEAGARFVIVGDLNADPEDGSGVKTGIRALLSSSFIQDPKPTSQGAQDAAQAQGQANTQHKTPAAQDTADFSDGQVGNLRVDYALPSANLKVVGSGVFWPQAQAPFAQDVNVSDHHLVWVDLEWPQAQR